MNRDADTCLLELLRLLKERGYCFVTTTPASHARVVARMDRASERDLRDLLGWSRPVPPGSTDVTIVGLLHRADMLEECGRGEIRSRVRVSSLHGELFLHSAYPTTAADAVFLGPDSYRFADQILAELAREPLKTGAHIVDMGAGAGVGGIVAGLASDGARVTLTDLNPQALRLARINASAAGVCVETIQGDDLSQVGDPIDLAVINPPYIVDESNRAYRDGGAMHGGAVPLAMARMAAQKLAPGGRLILYTGAAIIGGRNELSEALAASAKEAGLSYTCREIDPDVFGEELAAPAYADVERIALVVAVLKR